jgi:tRNA uridine 5-carbamoylmethylation protein Kti12
MITFKSTADLDRLPASDPAHPIVKELVNELITAYTTPGQPYNHEDYGYVILIQEGDTDRTLDEIWDGCCVFR